MRGPHDTQGCTEPVVDRDQDAQRELRMAVAAARLGTWCADLKTNTVVTRQFGGPVTGLPGLVTPTVSTLEEFMALVHPEDRARVTARLERAMAGEVDYLVEFRIVGPDQAVRWVHAQGELVRDEAGSPVSLVGVDMDITERKEREAERTLLDARVQHAQRLESLGMLAGGVAHDFNNLLTGILGNADLALMALPPLSRAREAIEGIKLAGIRAAELTRQMLNYSGRGRFVVEALDLNALVGEMSRLIPLAMTGNCALRYDLQEDLPPIEADPTQIRQVVMNLVTNAAEAIGEPNGLVTLCTGCVDADAHYLLDLAGAENLAPGKYVFLEVIDNGCGMDAATMEKIFDPFFTTKFTGRGLGLAGVLGIVRGHHGALRVYSEPGQGTTFKVLFPAAGPDVQPRRSETPHGEESTGTWSAAGGRVLVVDDDASVRSVMIQALERVGFSVITAEDGQVGVELFQRHSHELVLVFLDMTMPVLSGERAFRELRRIRPEVPVILMSGYNEVEATNRFTGKGLAGFLQKPFRVDDLVEVARTLLTRDR